MQKIGTTHTGSTLIEATPQDINSLAEALRQITASMLVMQETLKQFGQLAPTPQVSKVNPVNPVPPPQPAKRRKAITSRPPPTTTKGTYRREGSLIDILRTVMADNMPRHLSAIEPLVTASRPDLSGEGLRNKITICLATANKDFERTDRATYRLIAPSAANPLPPAAPLPPSSSPAAEEPDESILCADPAALTDHQLNARLLHFKRVGGSDRPGRLEYIRRSSTR